MVSSSANLDKWREYFRGASTDIFEIIEHAIMVAVSDCPYEFKLKRDRIAEMIFTCKVRKCFGCDRIELALPNADDGVEKSDDKNKSGIEAGGSKDTKGSETSSRRDDDHKQFNVNQVNNYGYRDVEALANEIEEESLLFEEVLRIKKILDNHKEESIDELFDSLRRLQLMALSVEKLKVTDIGKSVNALRKHGSNDIRNLAKTLIEDWKIMVEAYINANAAIAGEDDETESLKDVEEEEGLPSPPMDGGVYFTTTPPTPEELAQFFDGMDDIGNPRNSGEFNKNRDNGRKPNLEKRDIPRQKLNISDDSRTLPKDRNAEQKRNQDDIVKPAPLRKPDRPPSGEHGQGRRKSPSGQSGPGRSKLAVQQKTTNEIKAQQKHEKGSVQKKPVAPQQELNRNYEGSDRMNLEATKRKLQERYQEAENAKKQRTTQVVEMRNIPKNGTMRNQNMRAGNHNTPFPNGRR